MLNHLTKRSGILLSIVGLLITLPGMAYEEVMLGESSEVFIRDPFTPSRIMYEQAGNLSNIGSDAFGFQPGDIPDFQIPKMRLKGLITEKDTGEELALLEIIGSGVYMVREGDEINIDPRQPASAIRISDITRLSVTIETGTLGRIRVLR